MRETASPIAEPRRKRARKMGSCLLAASLVACLSLPAGPSGLLAWVMARVAGKGRSVLSRSW